MTVRAKFALNCNSQNTAPQTTHTKKERLIFRASLATLARLNATYHMDGPHRVHRLWQKGLPGRIEETKQMLWTITIILFVLWLVGMVSSYTLGGWIHLLLVLAVIVLIFNLLSGRRAV
jgi:hypothetical protein